MLGFHFGSSHAEVILHETSSNWKTLMTQLKWKPLYHFTYEHERREYLQNFLKLILLDSLARIFWGHLILLEL